MSIGGLGPRPALQTLRIEIALSDVTLTGSRYDATFEGQILLRHSRDQTDLAPILGDT